MVQKNQKKRQNAPFRPGGLHFAAMGRERSTKNSPPNFQETFISGGLLKKTLSYAPKRYPISHSCLLGRFFGPETILTTPETAERI